jgi:hypothetical protein
VIVVNADNCWCSVALVANVDVDVGATRANWFIVVEPIVVPVVEVAGISDLELGRKQLDTEEANIRRCLSAARVFMWISDHLEYDMEPGEVPASVVYPRLTNRPAHYNTNTRSPATAL